MSNDFYIAFLTGWFVLLVFWSTIVIFVPSLDQTEPISNPIYPPPIITSFLGTSLKDRAAVDDTMVFSSIFIPGKDVGLDPELITMFLA